MSLPPPALINNNNNSLQRPIKTKKTLLATPTDITPSLLNNKDINNENNNNNNNDNAGMMMMSSMLLLPAAFGGDAASLDVDERGADAVLETIMIKNTIPKTIPISNDIDERSRYLYILFVYIFSEIYSGVCVCAWKRVFRNFNRIIIIKIMAYL